MRFNFVSATGDGLGFAMRVQEEGNLVRMWIDDPAGQSIGDGLVPKVGDLEDLVHDADVGGDIFIFDTSGNGVLANGLKALGFRTIGASILADRLEKDRRFARAVMSGVGIDSPPSETFSDWDTAIKFAKGAKGRIVYKPSKRLGELSPSLVTYDQSDLVELLEGLKGRIEIEDIEFDLQAFVEGLEISTEGWFDGSVWLPLFNHTFERKHLMDGNIGPSGGCTGNVVWSCDGECPICKGGIRKIERFLRSNDYKGMIDLNCILDGDRLYGLEFTPRFGYDASPALLFSLLRMELGQFFADLAMGMHFRPGVLEEDKFASAVKITIPPWPTEKYTADSDVPIRGLELEDSVYWYNVKKGEATPYVSAGAWGIIMLSLGIGSTVATSFTKPYKMAERLRLQDKQYRTDLVTEFKKNVEELEAIVGVHRALG